MLMEYRIAIEIDRARLVETFGTPLRELGLTFAPRCEVCDLSPADVAAAAAPCVDCGGLIALLFTNGSTRYRRWVLATDQPLLLCLGAGAAGLSIGAITAGRAASEQEEAILRFLARTVEAIAKGTASPRLLAARWAGLRTTLEAGRRRRIYTDLRALALVLALSTILLAFRLSR